jgi:hypothetical protein
MRIKPEQTLFRLQTRRTRRYVVHSESLRRIIRACLISRYQRFRLADRIIQWIITKRGEQYIIQKFENPTHHCWCPSQPGDKERVECLTTSSPKEWIIKRLPDGSYTCVTCTCHLPTMVDPNIHQNLSLRQCESLLGSRGRFKRHCGTCVNAKSFRGCSD